MFYKILVGNRKGEIILIDEMIKSEGIVVTDKGEKLLMEQVAPLTEAEQEKYLTKVPIDLNAKKGLA